MRFDLSDFDRSVIVRALHNDAAAAETIAKQWEGKGNKGAARLFRDTATENRKLANRIEGIPPKD